MRFIWLISLLFPLAGYSQLRLAPIFSSNMLLQRDKPIPVWGKAAPGSKIEVRLGAVIQIAVASKDSTWKVRFPKQSAIDHPQSLYVSNGDTVVKFDNILVGDVWLCIGQSNMEWPMAKELHYKEELSNSRQPMLRLYNPAYAGKNTYNVPFTDSIIQNLTAENFYKGQWEDCDSNSFKNMSAVAYYFGKEIVSAVNIPVGLINLSIGGAPLETFISSEALKNNKQFADKVKGNWLNNDALPVWIRERGKQNLVSLTNVPKDEYGSNHAYKPGFAFEAGIEQLLEMPIKGIICYQGESNAQEIERVNEYAALSKLMIDDYRKRRRQTNLPFYFVQLSSIDTAKYKSQLWPQFRNEQRRMHQLIPNTGMAVCSDIGANDDVHPTNKKLVGERLARWALNKTYNRNLVPSGPLPLSARYKGGRVIISFQYLANGLKTIDGGPIKGFSFDGRNEAKAIFGDSTVLIVSDKKPAFVYYNWKSFGDGNLVNSENLPASTFKLIVK